MKKFNINIENIKRHSRDIYFGVFGIILLVGTIFGFAYSVEFLVSNLDTAVEVRTHKPDLVKFNIGALSELGFLITKTDDAEQ